MKWFIASRLRTDCQLRSTDSAMPPADSHCLSFDARLREPSGLTGCVCLHALSSFQRTDWRYAIGAPTDIASYYPPLGALYLPYPVLAVPARKARPPAESGVFRGTL